MPFKNLRHFIDTLDAQGELVRVKQFVDPRLEIAEITDRITKAGGPALLFENTGTDYPLLINAMGTERRMCVALGVDRLDDLGEELSDVFQNLTTPKPRLVDKLRMLPELRRMSRWMPKTRKGRGSCQEVVMTEPDLFRLPIMTCWPEDGGPFITFPVIHTKDPENGLRNVGLYRMQVFGPRLTALHWHKHKVSAGHFNAYVKRKERMPVAVALGGDPVYTYVASAPMPPNFDEYMLAGFIRKKPVQLVKCLTVDMWVPEDADFIIEGYVEPDEEFILEGPFGDHTGYYSLPDYYPRFHVTAITHRRDAVYPSTIVGIPPQEDAWIGKATERLFVTPIKLTLLPELEDMELPVEGVFHNLTILKIRKEYAGHGLKVMNAMWGAGQMMFNKVLVVTDEEVDIHDYLAVARLLNSVDPQTDIYFGQGPMDVLDHSCSRFAYGGKMFIDATRKVSEELRSTAIRVIDPTAIRIDSAATKQSFPEIMDINDSLLAVGIPIVAVSVRKERPGQVKALNTRLLQAPGWRDVKMILYCEEVADVTDIKEVIWRVTNNIDPKRDCFIVPAKDDTDISHIGVDGTRKTLELDGFDRPWPNIIVADDATMNSVDAKWEGLGLGPFIESPSRKFRKQLYSTGAEVRSEV
jgi:4-hydroxy-3-polyprenylbenzoate decarboxylase